MAYQYINICAKKNKNVQKKFNKPDQVQIV